MSKKEFDQKAIEAIKQLGPGIEIREAVSQFEDDGSFREEVNYQRFKDKGISGIEFSVPQDRRESFVAKLQSVLRGNFVVYFSEQHFGYEPDEITVLESSDRYDALRFEGCNGVNHGIHTEDIIAHLEELEKTNPFVLTGAGFDFIQGNFISPPSNIEELANRMYAFCPDIVDQGTEDVEGLIEALNNSNSFFYWWD